VEVNEDAGDVDHGAADGLVARFRIGDAGIDELARGGGAHLFALDEGGLGRSGDGHGAG